MERARNWQRHAAPMVREAAGVVGRERLRALQQRDGRRHAALTAAWLATGAAGALLATAERPILWPAGILLLGLFAFNGTVLLHEVLHGLVFARRRPRTERALGLLYALPSAIAPSQFTRWHLDHHAELGDAEADPKRHRLSPKRNSRLVKMLYWTPALFPIYFRAARAETATYPPALRRTVAMERVVGVTAHLALAALLVAAAGPAVWLRLHVLPLVVAFPLWFGLNRLGQHYAIDPADPAAWGTLLRPSPLFWDPLYLWSTYHLEHHYFPGVPAYRLPALRRALEPFFRERSIPARSYRSLVWDWFVRNKPPHADWQADTLAG